MSWDICESAGSSAVDRGARIRRARKSVSQRRSHCLHNRSVFGRHAFPAPQSVRRFSECRRRRSRAPSGREPGWAFWRCPPCPPEADRSRRRSRNPGPRGPPGDLDGVLEMVQQAAQRQASELGDALRVDLADGRAVLAAVPKLGRAVVDLSLLRLPRLSTRLAARRNRRRETPRSS